MSTQIFMWILGLISTQVGILVKLVFYLQCYLLRSHFMVLRHCLLLPPELVHLAKIAVQEPKDLLTSAS